MNPQTSTDNDHLFRASRQKREIHTEPTRSWWLSSETREAFVEAAEREQRRMQRGPGAKLARGMVVGNFRTVTGGK